MQHRITGLGEKLPDRVVPRLFNLGLLGRMDQRGYQLQAVDQIVPEFRGNAFGLSRQHAAYRGEFEVETGDLMFREAGAVDNPRQAHPVHICEQMWRQQQDVVLGACGQWPIDSDYLWDRGVSGIRFNFSLYLPRPLTSGSKEPIVVRCTTYYAILPTRNTRKTGFVDSGVPGYQGRGVRCFATIS